MRTYLKIFRTRSLDLEEMYRFMESMRDYGKMRFLLSDGILLDMQEVFGEDTPLDVTVQRILTSYQLQRILLESDDRPHFIAIISDVISTWNVESVESIYEIMKIKSYYHRCPISMNIVGKEGVYENYLGKRVLEPGSGKKTDGGIYEWEEQRQQ